MQQRAGGLNEIREMNDSNVSELVESEHGNFNSMSISQQRVQLEAP